MKIKSNEMSKYKNKTLKINGVLKKQCWKLI